VLAVWHALALAVTTVKAARQVAAAARDLPEREIHIGHVFAGKPYFPIGKVPLHSVGGRVRIS